MGSIEMADIEADMKVDHERRPWYHQDTTPT